MASLNKVFLIGNLTRDPELRYIPSGTAVTTFSLAVSRNYKTQNGENKEEVCFIRIVVWGKSAEACSQYLSKGKPVFVEGRLVYRSWEDQSGNKRNAIEVNADRVQFLGASPQREQTMNKFPGIENEDVTVDTTESISQDGEVPF
ncbi:MAG: single-stranded DNA-binding protein [Candidatus Omnitrophota bacterium]